MQIYIIAGSVREGRTAIKVARWVSSAIAGYDYADIQEFPNTLQRERFVEEWFDSLEK